MTQPNIDQLIKLLTQQQQQMDQQQKLVQQQSQQIAQLLTNAPAAGQPTSQAAITIPALPDVSLFEPSDEKSRVTEWLDRFKFALDCAAPSATDETKVKCLMNKMSELAFSEYSRSVLPAVVTDFNFATTIQKLEKLFAKPQSIFIDRYECLKAMRGEGEEFRQFINRHKKLLSDFKFDELKKEQFYCLMLLTSLKSHSDAALRQRILVKLAADGANVRYDGVVEDLINYQSTISEARALEVPNFSRNVNAVQQKRRPYATATDNQGKRGWKPTPINKKCWRCGGEHRPDKCLHKTAKCCKCHFPGHLNTQCDSVQAWRKQLHSKPWNKRVGHLRIGMAYRPINALSLLKVEILLNQTPVHVYLDTGSDANVIDERTYTKLGRPSITKCTEVGKTFDGTRISFIGKCFGTIEFGGIAIEQEFYVAKSGSLNLLSCEAMDKFGLLDELRQKIRNVAVNSCTASDGNGEKFMPNSVQIKGTTSRIEDLKRAFPDVFGSGLGCCTKEKAHLTLKDDARPVYRKARPVPYNSREIVERELERLENLGVIHKVDHLDWAAPILIVKKADGSSRLCIDYSTGLNDALLDCQHPLPIPEAIFAPLNGGRIFSQLDLRDAYFQIELDEESRLLCGLATHRGNYCMKRLPFGVKPAPGVFQSIMDKMLAGLDFATAYLDDILVVSGSQEEHIKHLKEVFIRIQSYGFRVKPEKCTFFRDQIKYLGQIIDKNGRRPDPSKIHAIAKMPAPKDISTLRSFLGMVNHYQQYVKNMRFIRKPLDDLLKRDNEWKWSEECQRTFLKLKEILTSELLLTHYDPKLELIVAADASEYGIGAVISHKFPNGSIKAVAHASKSLSPAEKNYSQIEKEGLALIFAVKKFHKMIYGRHFTLETDHKPLLGIFGSKKGIRQCSANRLIRWSLILLAYDFSIQYINTNDFGQADALSRLIAKGAEDEDERIIAAFNVESELESVLENAVKSLPLKFSDLVSASAKDAPIQQVLKFIRSQWPNEKQLANEEDQVRELGRRKAELSILKGCLMYGDRIVVPQIFQAKILTLLHKGHPGMKKMKQLARQYVFWPKLDQKIEDFVRTCEPCQKAAKAPVKTNLHSWPKSERPWQRIHIDYAGPFYGKEFLIVVDSFSKYPEIFEMTTKSTAATIERLRYLSTRHGIPETLVSDNGTQFTSNEFAKFTLANGIDHLFSAPTTPNDSLPGTKSPAEMLLGRKPRITLDLLRPPPPQPYSRDDPMERNFNRRFGTRPQNFASHEAVFARHRLSQNWKAGIIDGGSGVIYTVRFPEGSTGRYHANQLRRRHSPKPTEDPLDILNEAFNLPAPQRPPVEPCGKVEPEFGNQGNEDRPNGENAPPVQCSPEEPPHRQYPKRQRRSPVRFTPG
uniref:RNA-directed DNA polymerase n=1 Tax=Globodera rostochiensis TaxID=31243 RepID=A0A914HNG7_GLORO